MGGRRGVLVGVDGSDGAARAVDWAVAEATSLGSSLTLAYVLPAWPAPEVAMPPAVRAMGECTALDLMNGAAAEVRRRAPGLDVGALWAEGHAAVELLRLAQEADEIVVGFRGRGGFPALTLGSVAGQIAAHARCPVVVARGHATPGGPVVIGVDGSDRGEAALEFGFDHASRHGLAVLAVHVYHLSPPYPTPPADVKERQRSAQQLAGEAVRRWAEKYPEVAAEADADRGSAAGKLVDATKGASLLVVGSKGHGGVAGLVLGSVSQAVLRHAHCPVAVVR